MSIRAGFIGLGSLGAPIARRLARQGFDLTGCDISEEMLAAFDEPGAKRSNDPIETARQAEMLGVCVRTDAQLRSLAGDGRLFEALGEGGLVLLHSTVSPDLARELAAKAKQYGVGFVDVGSSGGQPAALEGKLSLFIGAEDADLERAKPWLEAIGSQLSHLGPVGRGQEGKLLNNLISIANYGMSASIVDLGVDMGFDRQQLIDAFNAGSAQSFALRVGPGMVQPRPDAHGAPSSFQGLHDLLKKDVDHCRDLPVSETVSLAGLVAAADVMLARIRRAQAEAEGRAPADRQKTVDAYFAAVRVRDIDAWMALFAEDATYALPNGQLFTGKPAIREFQQMVFGSGSPVPNPGIRFVAPEGIAVEIEAQLADGSVRNTTNHYRFDDGGLIRSLTVYMRG